MKLLHSISFPSSVLIVLLLQVFSSPAIAAWVSSFTSVKNNCGYDVNISVEMKTYQGTWELRNLKVPNGKTASVNTQYYIEARGNLDDCLKATR